MKSISIQISLEFSAERLRFETSFKNYIYISDGDQFKPKDIFHGFRVANNLHKSFLDAFESCFETFKTLQRKHPIVRFPRNLKTLKSFEILFNKCKLKTSDTQ